MPMTTRLLAALAASLPATMAMAGGFASFTDQTAARLVADGDLGANDDQEKDYAWGDVDQDGDIDLVCVRKEPFTTTGREPNVLFMNEGGVLVDRTAQYASASDATGDQGFLTAINDRDVLLVDLTNDGWLDMVTATTLMDYEPEFVSHPRIYVNLGEVDGVWQGFRYEKDRIPRMHDEASPRFCSVAAGDLTGDGIPDLYFGDYDSGPSQVFDYNNRLLINDGNGYFTDQSNSRMDSEMLLSAFGAASVIVDMNNDGVNDVVKQTSLNPPQHVAITYNNPANEGYFNGYDIIDSAAPYFVNCGDLNGDGRLDMVVTDDGSDTYYLNTGNGGDGMANFSVYTFENSGGFGGNSIIADLNNDGHQDVIITDVDVDISGCSRTTHIYRNLGNAPNVTFNEESVGIPSSMLLGVHDAAVFDLNGDGWLDIVMGRCGGTEIWIQDAPVGLVFSYPDGLPGFIPAGQTFTFRVQLTAVGGGTPQENSASIIYRVDGGKEIEEDLVSVGTNIYEATLPAAECAQAIEFRLQGRLEKGGAYSDPPSGWHEATVGDGTEIVLRDEIEGDVSAWSVVNDDSLSTGAWEQADPNGTLYGTEMAAPEDDATAGSQNVQCFITENGDVGGAVGAADVDGGPTTLVAPTLDLAGTDGIVSYSRWFFDSQSTDSLFTWISADGGNSWTQVDSTGGTDQAWEPVSFRVGAFVEPSDSVVVAFQVVDGEPASVVEAGIDNFQLEKIICDESCYGDVTGDGDVGVADILAIIAAWGSDDAAADVDKNGIVAVGDVLAVISGWGPCV